jgi:hypothetical protein
VVTAVAPFSKGVTAAAARGWDPISANFLMPKWVATHRDSYALGCVDGGRDVDYGNWRVAKSIFVAKDMATQEKIAYRLGDSYKRFNEYANAEKWFQKSVELNGGLLPLFQLGLMQKQ